MAQWGARQTEDLKAPGSIRVFAVFFFAFHTMCWAARLSRAAMAQLGVRGTDGGASSACISGGVYRCQRCDPVSIPG